ncbi:hypothetical protein COO60DRAFT_1298160 [Scenedesmus sp. NREL 46B-D3]|nr:hypothetical protein COO60DRAFT_1298160 [Scenedesmus sp. NREL 46B-D3]
MSHIRKQASRKERRKAMGSEGGSQADAAEFDRRSQRSAGSAARSAAGRTARASEWGHTAIFDDDEHAATRAGGAAGPRGPGSVAGRSRPGAPGSSSRGGARLAGDGAAADPQDLLEAATARQLVQSAAGASGGAGGRAGAAGAGADFPRGDDGRMVIKEAGDEFGHQSANAARRLGKRRRNDEDEFGGLGDEDDSDMEDMRGFAGLKAAVKSVANAKSVKFAPSIAASLGNRSTASKRSAGGRSEGRPGSGKGSQHSGERFRAKEAAGDVKGKGGVDPYAYWQFDRKMLNRRRGKQAEASKGLGGVVAGAKAGALKGAKAKRAANAKRARR